MSVPPTEAPLAYDELHKRLESLVYMVLSYRRSVEMPARELAVYGRADQERFLRSVELIGTTSTELAYNFCMFATRAVSLLDGADWDEWTLHIMAQYDGGGVLAAISAMQQVQSYAEAARHAHTGANFQDVRAVLERFVLGLSGRPLRLSVDERVHTDTETLYLPAGIQRFPSRAENYRLYKAMAAHLWAQTWFGSWRRQIADEVAGFADPERATRLLHVLETVRLDAAIRRDLPGLHREMQALGGPRLPPSRSWKQAVTSMAAASARVDDSLELLRVLYGEADDPEPACYQGVLLPERVAVTMSRRVERERVALSEVLASLAAELASAHASQQPDGREERFSAVAIPSPERPDGMHFELRLQGEPIAPNAELRQLLDSIAQDLGCIPDEHLVPAGHGRYRDVRPTPPSVESVGARSSNVFCYDEWDYLRKHYRKDWCLLHEKDVHPHADAFVEQTLDKYRGLLKHLYRTFEALRGEERRLKKQPFGDEVDIDALVESLADQRVGLEGSDRLFTRMRRIERNIAVVFMVDMSGSTKGWINDIVRESLVLLCESLETLGDRYAIYGFSGFTHKRCELYRIKRFEEAYNQAVRARISGIKPHDYTRMGAFVRHLTAMLLGVEARTKVLITLSDGRPDDQDGYRGQYGIEDTRQALFEARCEGVHPFCITIDDEALEYLPHMYGTAGFTVIDQVAKLPLKVSEIYRRLTM